MDFEMYDDMTIEELYEELEDLHGAFHNECLWGAGAHTAADFNMHVQNATDILDRIDYVKELIGGAE